MPNTSVSILKWCKFDNSDEFLCESSSLSRAIPVPSLNSFSSGLKMKKPGRFKDIPYDKLLLIAELLK